MLIVSFCRGSRHDPTPRQRVVGPPPQQDDGPTYVGQRVYAGDLRQARSHRNGSPDIAALITCSWCNHGIVRNELHGRIKIDQTPKQCADCSECKARRLRGDASGAEDDVDVTQIPIEQAETGMSLVVKRDGHACLFQVENKKFSYRAGKGTVFTLVSEPVDGGAPWVITGPRGTLVHRVTRKR